jgi:hypothetical protein
MEDSEVEEGDWRGLSKGEAETEGADESVGRLRFSATRLGTAVDDMMGVEKGILYEGRVLLYYIGEKRVERVREKNPITPQQPMRVSPLGSEIMATATHRRDPRCPSFEFGVWLHESGIKAKWRWKYRA